MYDLKLLRELNTVPTSWEIYKHPSFLDVMSLKWSPNHWRHKRIDGMWNNYCHTSSCPEGHGTHRRVASKEVRLRKKHFKTQECDGATQDLSISQESCTMLSFFTKTYAEAAQSNNPSYQKWLALPTLSNSEVLDKVCLCKKYLAFDIYNANTYLYTKWKF